MTEKMLGYVFIAIGVVVIAVCGVNAYDVFTGRMQPLAVYSASKTTPSVAVQPAEGTVNVSALIQPVVESALSQTMGGSMEKPINLTIHLLLLGFIASLGYRIASLGTMLVRPIVVSVRGVTQPQTGGQQQA